MKKETKIFQVGIVIKVGKGTDIVDKYNIQADDELDALNKYYQAGLDRGKIIRERQQKFYQMV